MKKLSLLMLMLLFNSSLIFAQVAINTDGSAPNSSAMFDIKSANKGVLLPRMTIEELYDIPDPAEGLIVFCTDCGSNNIGALAMFLAGSWYTLNADCLNAIAPVEGSHNAMSTQIEWNWNSSSGVSGCKWNTIEDFESAENMQTSTSKTETGLTCNTSYTRYVWAYNACGASDPVTLSASTTATSSDPPAEGTHIPSITQIIWNWNTVTGATGYKWNTIDNYESAEGMGLNTTKTETGLTCNYGYTRYVWAYTECGNSSATVLTQSTSITFLEAPTAGTNVATKTQIEWNWNTVSGATGYKWSSVNNYAGAMDMFNSTTVTETGLTCEFSYTRYVWAYDFCSVSAPLTLTHSTTACWICGDPIAKTHVAGNVAPVDKTTTYGTVTPDIPWEDSRCWITSNLGSDHQANAATDASEASAGWYWQFNRMQGYKHDGTLRTPNTDWINYIDENSNWLAANDPCTIELGNGWRLPTSNEWTNIDANGNWTTRDDIWESDLKIHAAGNLNSGSPYARGDYGYYSSSSQYDNTYMWYLWFNAGSCGMYHDDFKAAGFSVRCVKDI